jgi:hypothetical protein
MFRQASMIFSGTALLGVVLATTFLTGCAGLLKRDGGEMAVVAEGWAPANAKDPDGTRRRALADAQKKAVEQVSGVAVSALTRVQDSVTLRQKITAEVRGFVSHYDVLDEKEEMGFFKVRIRAFIRPGEVPRPAAPPSTDVRFSLTVKGSGLSDEDLGASASTAIRRELLAQGFNIDDSTDSWSMQGAAASVPILDARLGSFHSARAHVSLRVVEPKTQAVVWETSQEASALGLDPGSAALAAAQAAGTLAGRQAAGEVSEVLWKRF